MFLVILLLSQVHRITSCKYSTLIGEKSVILDANSSSTAEFSSAISFYKRCCRKEKDFYSYEHPIFFHPPHQTLRPPPETTPTGAWDADALLWRTGTRRVPALVTERRAGCGGMAARWEQTPAFYLL